MNFGRLLFSVLISLSLLSCKDDSSSSEQGPATPTLIGGIGTHRTYVMTVSWFLPSTDTPAIQIPDSLVARVTLSDSLRRLGVVRIIQQPEEVVILDTSFYNRWHLPLPMKAYKLTGATGSYYDLREELTALIAGLPYTAGTWYSMDVWHETENVLEKPVPGNLPPVYPSCPWIKKPLTVSQEWVRYQRVDTAHGSVAEQLSAKVMGVEEVKVKAGTFKAHKIAIASLGGNPFESAKEIEYYVTNVGLVLSENDRTIGMSPFPWSGGTGDIEVREVTRRELISYSIKPE